MPEIFRTTRRVEFCETDAAGIVHFAWLLCYMEQAEHQFQRHVGTSVMIEQNDGSHLSWPRVRVEADFQGPARFEDQLDITVSVERLGSKSITYAFDIRCEQRPIATGKSTAVFSRVRIGSPMQSVEIPDWLREKFKPFVRL